MADVFLSYASSDRDRVAALAVAIEGIGVSVWWDRRIDTGSSFDREIERQLEDARCVIVVWTNASVDSDWVRSEAAEGLAGRKLMPVQLDDVKPPLAFRRIQTADVRRPEGLTAFLDELRARFDLATAVAPASDPNPASVVAGRRIGPPIAGVLLGVVLVGAAVLFVLSSSSPREEVQQHLPELTGQIRTLLEEEAHFEAFRLIGPELHEIPPDHALRELMEQATSPIDIRSEPAGALVSLRPYGGMDDDWMEVGRTPLIAERLPIGVFEWRFQSPGFTPAHRIRSVGLFGGALRTEEAIQIDLEHSASTPAGMVRIAGGESALFIPGHVQSFFVESFYIDAREVSNSQFQEFVDAGGYATAEYWQGDAFRVGDRDLFPEVVRDRFVDTTARPGPAGWEFGRFREGEEALPVTGVSWYEALAYARYRGHALPTVFHWAKAALGPFDALVVEQSNLGGSGMESTRTSRGLGPFGTFDTAGNAREWTATADGEDRWILGGSWEDPPYAYNLPAVAPPLDRSAVNGFRTMSTTTRVEDALPRDMATRKQAQNLAPVSEEVYRAFADRLSYVSRQPRSVEVSDFGGDRRKNVKSERVSITMNDGTLLPVLLFRPDPVVPDGQALLLFDGSYMFSTPVASADYRPSPLVDWVVASGRSLIVPIWKGSYERRDDFLQLPEPRYTQVVSARFVEWRQELGVTLDVLEELGIIDPSRVAYLGISFGGAHAFLLAAVEERLSAAVLIAAGIGFRPMPPEVDTVNYLPRITIPTLMLNGEFDSLVSREAQLQMFSLLGTPAPHKRQVLFKSGHANLPRAPMIREATAWLDEHLGAAR